MRILLVDDDRTVRTLMCRHLRQAAEVVEAASAAEALRCLDSTKFDLLITDFNMPGGSGLWLLEQIRGRRMSIPSILISGSACSGEVLAAAEAATGFLPKPFDFDQLDRCVDLALRP